MMAQLKRQLQQWTQPGELQNNADLLRLTAWAGVWATAVSGLILYLIPSSRNAAPFLIIPCFVNILVLLLLKYDRLRAANYTYLILHWLR